MGKKIFNFSCANEHVFEGWFNSDEHWRSERDAGRFVCPVCGSANLVRRPTAPNFSRVKGTTRTDIAGDVRKRDEKRRADMQAKAIKALRSVAEKAEDVGRRFPEEVRGMHEGRTPIRLVKGECAPEEAQALREEGIPVMPLPEVVTKKLN